MYEQLKRATITFLNLLVFLKPNQILEVTFSHCCLEFSCLVSRLAPFHYLLWLQNLASSYKMFVFSVYKSRFSPPNNGWVMR